MVNKFNVIKMTNLWIYLMNILIQEKNILIQENLVIKFGYQMVKYYQILLKILRSLLISKKIVFLNAWTNYLNPTNPDHHGIILNYHNPQPPQPNPQPQQPNPQPQQPNPQPKRQIDDKSGQEQTNFKIVKEYKVQIKDYGKTVILEKVDGSFTAIFLEENASEKEKDNIILQLNDIDQSAESQLKLTMGQDKTKYTKVLFLEGFKGIAIKWVTGLITKFLFQLNG